MEDSSTHALLNQEGAIFTTRDPARAVEYLRAPRLIYEPTLPTIHLLVANRDSFLSKDPISVIFQSLTA